MLQVRARGKFGGVHAGVFLHFIDQAGIQQRVHDAGFEIAADHLVPPRAVGFLQAQHVGQAEAMDGFGEFQQRDLPPVLAIG